MDLPKPSRPHRKPSNHAEYVNSIAYGIGSSSRSQGSSQNPPGLSSRALRDEAMERVAAAVTVSKTMPSALSRDRMSPTPRDARLPKIALAADMRMLGVGTSMRRSRMPEAPTPEIYPNRGAVFCAPIRPVYQSAIGTGTPAHSTAGRERYMTDAPYLQRDFKMAGGVKVGAEFSAGATTGFSSALSAPLTSSWNGVPDFGTAASGTAPDIATGASMATFSASTSSKPLSWHDSLRGSSRMDGDMRMGGSDNEVHTRKTRRPPYVLTDADTEPPASVLTTMEEWSRVDVGRGEYGRGVSGRQQNMA